MWQLTPIRWYHVECLNLPIVEDLASESFCCKDIAVRSSTPIQFNKNLDVYNNNKVRLFIFAQFGFAFLSVLVQEPDMPIMHPPPGSSNFIFFRNLIPSRFENQNVPSKILGSTVYFTDRHFTDQGFLSAIRTWHLPSFQLKLASKLIETYQKCSRYLEL